MTDIGLSKILICPLQLFELKIRMKVRKSKLKVVARLFLNNFVESVKRHSQGKFCMHGQKDQAPFYLTAWKRQRGMGLEKVIVTLP